MSMKKPAAKSAQAVPMAKADVSLAYHIMDATNSFPVDVLRTCAPKAWRLAEAFGRASSSHASAMFVQLMVLVSLTLNAVQVKYSGLLGRFSNLVVIQHGPPGDSKSVILCVCLQILYYYDKKRYDKMLAQWKQDDKKARKAVKRNGAPRNGQGAPNQESAAAGDGEDETDDEEIARPSKPDQPDSVLNRCTMIGAGPFLEKQNGVALLALHEARGWMTGVFDGGPGGGVEDLNQIMDHDAYKNYPANSAGKFHIRNVHLPGILLMHLEEIIALVSKPDSLMGFARFLVGKISFSH